MVINTPKKHVYYTFTTIKSWLIFIRVCWNIAKHAKDILKHWKYARNVLKHNSNVLKRQRNLLSPSKTFKIQALKVIFSFQTSVSLNFTHLVIITAPV